MDTVPKIFFFMSLALLLTPKTFASPPKDPKAAAGTTTIVADAAGAPGAPLLENGGRKIHPKGEQAGPPVTVDQACAMAVDKAFCAQTLKSSPESKGLDIKDMAFLTLKIAQKKGEEINTFIAGKLDDEDNSGNDDSPEDSAIYDCSEQYEDAMAQIEDSMNAFVANAPKDIITWMSTAITDADTCEKSFTEYGAKMEDSMKAMTTEFSKLCSVALAVCKLAFKQ